MKQKYLNLVLLVVVGVLIWLVVRDQKQEEQKIAKAIERQPPLTELVAGDIKRIKLKNIGSPEIVLERGEAGWDLTAPVRIQADLVQIGNLTALATTETRGSINTARAKRADLGLDPAKTVVQLDDVTLGVGEIEPLKRTRYIELNPGVADNRISLVDDFSATAIDGDFTDLVNKALIPASAKIMRIEAPGLKVERNAAGDGWIATPPSAQATAENLAEMNKAWHEVRAIATLPPDTNDKASQKPTLAVTLADGSTLRYAIISKGESIFLERRDVPVSYQFVPTDVERLSKPLKPVDLFKDAVADDAEAAPDAESGDAVAAPADDAAPAGAQPPP